MSDASVTGLTLLDEAKQQKCPRKLRGTISNLATTDERIDLSLAVIRGDVTVAQAQAALMKRGYKSNSRAEQILSYTVWMAARRGELIVSRKP